jgi:hypothetical protein
MKKEIENLKRAIIKSVKKDKIKIIIFFAFFYGFMLGASIEHHLPKLLSRLWY